MTPRTVPRYLFWLGIVRVVTNGRTNWVVTLQQPGASRTLELTRAGHLVAAGRIGRTGK